MLLLASASLPAEVLRLAGNVWPPYTDRSLPGEGLSVELIRTALGRGGYQVEYIEVPWERALLGLRNGSYDMINGWPTVRRVDYTLSSRPFLSNRMRWVQRRESNFRYDGLDSLVGHPIALSRGYMYSDELNEDTRLQKGYAANFVQAAKMVIAGRVDLTLEDERTALFHLERELGHERDALRFVPGEFRRVERRWWCAATILGWPISSPPSIGRLPRWSRMAATRRSSRVTACRFPRRCPSGLFGRFSWSTAAPRPLARILSLACRSLLDQVRGHAA